VRFGGLLTVAQSGSSISPGVVIGRSLLRASFVALALAWAGSKAGIDASPAPPAARAACPVSERVRDSAPRDPGAGPVRGYWYRNADRTIWAGFLPERGWEVGGNKTYWVRPRGTELTVAGRRLDTAAPPLRASIPCCCPGGFQIVGLFFPTEGCWEVTATSGSGQLRFVTVIRPDAGSRSSRAAP